MIELAAAISDACSMRRFGGQSANTTSVSWSESRGSWGWLFPEEQSHSGGSIVIRSIRRTGAEEVLLPPALVRAASRAADAEESRRERMAGAPTTRAGAASESGG